jgi:hypothetical protein
MLAGVARQVASVISGGNFGTTQLEIEMTARDATSGDCYVFARRYIRMNNGVPVIVVLGTDAVANATVTIAAAGTSGVTVSITPTRDIFASVVVRTSAGGASTATAIRGAYVSMA